MRIDLKAKNESVYSTRMRTIASEVGGAEDHGGWKYTFVLRDDRITVKSGYPDQEFYKQ